MHMLYHQSKQRADFLYFVGNNYLHNPDYLTQSLLIYSVKLFILPTNNYLLKTQNFFKTIPLYILPDFIPSLRAEKKFSCDEKVQIPEIPI